MTVAGGLSHVAGRIGAQRRWALVLACAAAVLVVFAVAAVLARLGWWSSARWVPAALWLLLAALAWWILRAGARLRPGSRDVAAIVEREQRLRRGALVGLFDVQHEVPAGTSRDLADRAERRVSGTLPQDPDAWTPVSRRDGSRRVRNSAAVVGAALMAALVSFWFAGDAAAMLVSPVRAFRHVLKPLLTIEASDRAVPAGTRVTITVQAEAGTPRAALRVRERGEGWRIRMIDLDAAGRGTEVLAIGAPTFVFAEATGRSSDTLAIEVIRPLVLGDFAVTARYPAYLEREDEQLDPSTGLLTVPVGTVFTVRGAASTPLAAAVLAGPDTVTLGLDGTRFEGRLTVRRDSEWRLAIRDRAGATLPDGPTLQVRAVPDSVPVVTMPVPGADTTAPLDLKPAIVVDARDDHGLRRVEIVSWRVSRLGLVSDTVVDSLAGVAGADRLVQTEILDLNNRGLLPGDTLKVFVRAADRSPSGQWGRSPTYSLRLRSLAEMREAVRAEADSLASRASAMAAEQTELNRETRDLAAQRNRAGERTQPPRAEAQRGTQKNENSSMNFEQAAEAQRLTEQQEQLMARADSLRADLQELAQAAREAGLNDPEWQRQLADLDRLLREAMTPELQRRMEELRRALQSLDPRQVQDALRRLSEQQQQLREELQRSAELFERAAIEGAMQTSAAEAEALRQEQQQWAERAPGRSDSAQAAREQQQLQQSADSLHQRLEQLEERLEQRGDSAASQAAGESADRVERAGQQMQQAQQQMQQGQRSQAAASGQQAAQELSQVPQRLQEASERQANQWRNEVLEKLGRATHETVQLAMEEQRLAQEVRQGSAGPQDVRGRQSALEQGINQTMRTLQQAAGSNALVSPRLGAMMAQAREQVARSRQALEGPSPSPDEAAERASDAARMLAAAAQSMMRNAEDVGGSQSGSGFAEAMERMGQMAGQQGQINDQLGGLLPMLGSGDEAVRQQLRMLAERQRQLANQMERLGENMPGRAEQLAEEARQLADRMEQGRLDRATLERQQRLFRRMLDAGRSLRNDEEPEDPERQSRTGEARERAAPPGAPRTGLRYAPPPWRDLRSLSPEERAFVLEYFRRLNAQPQ